MITAVEDIVIGVCGHPDPVGEPGPSLFGYHYSVNGWKMPGNAKLRVERRIRRKAAKLARRRNRK